MKYILILLLLCGCLKKHKTINTLSVTLYCDTSIVIKTFDDTCCIINNPIKGLHTHKKASDFGYTCKWDGWTDLVWYTDKIDSFRYIGYGKVSYTCGLCGVKFYEKYDVDTIDCRIDSGATPCLFEHVLYTKIFDTQKVAPLKKNK